MKMKEYIFELNPTEVKIKEDLPRYRKEMPKIKELLSSIEKFGQFVPIIITRNKELVDGGRRLAACLLGERKVKCIYSDLVTPLEIREIELEANIQREQYSPVEEAEAIADLHRIKQELYGKSQSGREGGWRLKDTAASIGKTKGTVIESIHIAEAIKNFPELRELKTKKAVKSAYKALDQVTKRAEAVEILEKEYETKDSRFDIIHKDALEDMPYIADNSVDILLTDPPYGIEIDVTAQQIGGKNAGISKAGYKFADDKDKALFLYNCLAKESYRFCKDSSHAYIFLAPEHFSVVREIFIQNGWEAWVRPIIWIKRSIGHCNVPSRWPASCYEMVLYCRRKESYLVKEGMPDWFQCNPVLPSERIHPTEKPTDVLINLLERVAMPGQFLYDPFMGSGSSIEAGLRLDLICRGCDIDKDAYAAALTRISQCDFSAHGNLLDHIDRELARREAIEQDVCKN